jgi:HPt (histidine-containing phosphotransfer) domain-containing protein
LTDARPPGGFAEPADGPVLDAAMIEQLRRDLDARMRDQLVDAFRAQLRASVAQLQRAIDEGDDAECRRLAHGLKGSSATMGANRLQCLCERLGHGPRGAVGAADVARLQRLADEALSAVAEALA